MLLVDDDLNVTNAIRRNLHRNGQDWNIAFCHSTDETLELLRKEQFHILFSDIRMPGKDGFHLLKTVLEKYPAVVRIIFSGHFQEDSVLDSVRYAHQYVSKPIDYEVLVHTIEYICTLQDLLNNQSLEEEVGRLHSLQTLPENYLNLLKELRNEDPSLQRIAGLIKNDLALTARVLQLVNSAFFGVPHHVNNCEQAVTLLGVANITCLLVSARFFSIFEGGPIPVLFIEKLWRHSLDVAGLARDIAQYENAPVQFADACVLAGMLHDIGKLVLLKIPSYRNAIADQSGQVGIDNLELEMQLFETTHAEAGGYLLGIWGIEAEIVDTVLHHHRPERHPSVNGFSPLMAICAANHLVKARNQESSETEFDQLIEYMGRCGLEGHYSAWKRISEIGYVRRG